MTFEVKLLITFVATHPLVILTKFGQNRMKHVEEEANCEKKEEEEETRSGNRSGHSRMIFAGGSDPKLTLTP
jgi:hypothetical protein